MKRITFFTTITLLLFVFTDLNAQNYGKATRVFAKGQADLQFGIGLTGTFIADKASMTSIPLSLSFDYMAGKKFSIGAFGAHSVSEGRPNIFKDGGVGQWTNAYTEVGLRFGIHFTKLDNWDIYGGPSIAMAHSKITPLQGTFGEIERHMGIKPVTNTALMGAFVGFKYAISEKIVCFSEIGIGATIFKVGVGYKIF